ncbi:MAG: GIY-YIG nuclease family protein [Bryobacterales bacterium]|nr:GIY-YIG nuclease family protein [Bryobacterales bacterium]
MSSKTKTLPVQHVPGIPKDVAAIRKRITAFLDTMGGNGRKVGNSKWRVYAFYDYDGEPIYVGQTNESLRVRIRRHLTNHRTDAVAMNVLDPFEVKEIEVWPLWGLEKEESALALLCAAEYAVYARVLKESMFNAVLNEKVITAPSVRFRLPKSYRGCIIPDELIEERSHPDIRLARRATTIAALAKVICERKVSKGLRRTLTVHAKRLEWLASERFKQIVGSGISDNEEED